MSAAVFAARAELRRRRAAAVGLAVLVAIVSTVLLAAVAGARRSSTVVDRFLEATHSRDLGVFAITLGSEGAVDGPELIGRIGRRLDETEGVTETGISVGYPTAASDEFDVAVIVSPDATHFSTIDRPILREGRMPAPGSPDEVTINDVTARLLDVGVGDTFRAPTFSPDDCAALLADEGFPGFNGPELNLRIVGRVLMGEDLRGAEATSGPIAIGSPAFIDRYGDEVCATVVLAAVRTSAGGPSTNDVQALVDAETKGLEKGLVSTVEDDFGRTVRSAVDTVSTVLLLVAIVATAAGLVAVGQAVRRQTAAGAQVGGSLSAIGLSRWQRSFVVAGPAIAAVVAGVAAGVALAWLASSQFPTSLARAVEPDPGRSFDALVLLAGGALMAAAGVGWSLVAARLAGDSTQEAVAARPSKTAELAARAGLRLPTVIGLRLAFERGQARARVPSRSALSGVAVGVLGVVAVLVAVASIDDTVDDPARYGWSWSSMPDVETDDPESAIAALEAGPTVAAAARLIGGAVEVEGLRLQGHAVEDLFGSTALVIAEGRAPATEREIALGGRSLRDLAVSVGDVVSVEDDDGGRVELTIVGQAVLPIVNDTNDPGSGAALVPDALDRLTRGETEDNLVLTYWPGVDPEGAKKILAPKGLGFPGYADPQVPGRLLNLRDTRGVFVALAAFLALLALAGLVHTLAVSGRRRRLDFAVLRALGFVRGQVRRAIRWQTAAIMVTGCMVGLPLGLVVGRISWRLAVADLHMREKVSTPTLAIGTCVVVALGIAALVAVVPGALAARRHPTDLLRAE